MKQSNIKNTLLCIIPILIVVGLIILIIGAIYGSNITEICGGIPLVLGILSLFIFGEWLLND